MGLGERGSEGTPGWGCERKHSCAVESVFYCRAVRMLSLREHCGRLMCLGAGEEEPVAGRERHPRQQEPGERGGVKHQRENLSHGLPVRACAAADEYTV